MKNYNPFLSRMKDKPAKRFNMSDLVHEYADVEKTPTEKQADLALESVKIDNIDSSYLDSLAEYNLNIVSVLDEDYKRVRPLHNVLVRVFVKEPEVTKDGLIKPYKQIVPVPTQNGMATWAEIESPYPYDNIAIVVATPDSMTSIKAGDVIQLSKNPVDAKVIGQSNEAYLTIPNAYWIPEYKGETPTKDPLNKHFGYLLIPYFEIKAVI